MKKIGIVTYIKNYNYGSALQAYALQEAIAGRGYDSRLIDYLDMGKPWNVRVQRRVVLNRLMGALHAPSAALKLERAKGGAVPSKEKRERFDVFYGENIKYSVDDYTEKSAYDAIVCGSDQVWSLAVPGLNWRFFLRFTSAGKRVAYAPSFGTSIVPRWNRRLLEKYLREFAYVSVRELSGARIARDAAGLDVPVVLDPVLLVGKSFWESVAPHQEGDYIACYFLSDEVGAIGRVKALSRALGLPVLWFGDRAPAGEVPQTVGPLDFVSALSGASYVCTDSFHGAAFSLLFGKDFSVFDRNYEHNRGQSTRIDSLFELCGVKTEKVENRRDVVSWDRAAVEKRLGRLRDESERFLFGSLKAVAGIVSE